MKRKYLIGLVGSLALVIVLAVGVGLAVAQQQGDDAQSSGQTPPAQGFREGRGPGRMAAGLVAGQVTKIDGNTITVQGPKGKDRAVNVDDKTRYKKPDGSDASLGDIKVGDRIGVQVVRPVPKDGSNPTASEILVGLPAPQKPVVGNVTAVNGDTVTIQKADGSTQDVKIPAISNGMRIGVRTAPDGTVTGIEYNPPQKPAAPAGAPAPEGGSTGQQS